MLSIVGISVLAANGLALVPFGGSAWALAAQAGAAIVRCKPCLYALGVAALLIWTAVHVHRSDVAQCSARIEDDHRRAAAAAAERDSNVARDLNTFFRPKLSQLQAENKTLQDKVKTYAKRKPVAQKPAAAAAGGCKLGDAADLLRRSDQSR